MALKTAGKIKANGDKYYFSTIQVGNSQWSHESKVYLISVGLDGAQYDFWAVNGTVYFGQWELPAHMSKDKIEVVGKLYFGATIEKGGGRKAEGFI